MNTLARAVKAIEMCSKAEKNWLRLWMNGEFNMLALEEAKKEMNGESSE
tara:strand:- start:1081 stop:1227 length:147 start_codon:yes stop_codon:yes gene_type:complete